MNHISGKNTLESMSQAVWYNQWTLNKFKKYLKGEILEVGCGIGNFTKSLLDFGKVFAIDINTNYIKEVSKLIKDRGKAGFGNIENGKYFFGEKQFDTIICLNVLEHIKKDQKALKNLYGLLKDGGNLILLVPAHQILFGKIDQSIGHFRRYSKKDLISKIKTINFSIVYSKRLNFLGAIGWWVTQNILGEDSVNEEKIRLFNIFAPLFLSFENLIEPPIGTSILVIARR